MADYLVTDSELTSVADAIRAKGGTSASLSFPAGFVSAIDEIPTGSGGTYTWFGANPVLLSETEYTLTLDDTSYPSWTPSTSSSTILPAHEFELLPYVPEINYELYDVALVMQYKANFKYTSGTEIKSTPRAFFYNVLSFYGYFFGTTLSYYNSGNGTSKETYTSSDYRLFYYNSSGSLMVGSGSYGIYTNGTPSFAATRIDGDTYLRATSPPVLARCHATYFSTAAAAAVDTANSIITFKTKTYRVDKPNVKYQFQKMVSDDWRALT